jgi:hypothetical protein
MTPKERFDAFMKLSDFRFARWVNRRQHEWRVSFGLWAGMAGATVALRNSGIRVAVFMVFILSVVVLGHAWQWVRWNWKSNERDIRSAFYYAEYAQRILLGSGAPEPSEARRQLTQSEEDGLGFLKAGPCRFQIAATAVLALVLVVYLLQSK